MVREIVHQQNPSVNKLVLGIAQNHFTMHSGVIFALVGGNRRAQEADSSDSCFISFADIGVGITVKDRDIMLSDKDGLAGLAGKNYRRLPFELEFAMQMPGENFAFDRRASSDEVNFIAALLVHCENFAGRFFWHAETIEITALIFPELVGTEWSIAIFIAAVRTISIAECIIESGGRKKHRVVDVKTH